KEKLKEMDLWVFLVSYLKILLQTLFLWYNLYVK
ncbi:MAG: hypothetical protein ACD_15C00125G0001, partial [uncultured bacterium]